MAKRKKKEREYEVTLERTEEVDTEAKVRVKAISPEEAKQKALDMANNGKLRLDAWDTLSSETTRLDAGEVEEVE